MIGNILTIFLFNWFSTSLAIQDLSIWKQVFINYTYWTGSYQYEADTFTCTMNIYHVETSGLGAVYAGFKDADTSLDFEGGHLLGEAKYNVQFRKSNTFSSTSNRIIPEKEFEITGVLKKLTETSWEYAANVTEPKNNKFSKFRMTAMKDETKDMKDNRSLQIGLTVGIVLTCALLGVAVLVSLVIWGIRKGYIRHVPSNYENFKNPSTRFDVSEGNVHI